MHRDGLAVEDGFSPALRRRASAARALSIQGLVDWLYKRSGRRYIEVLATIMVLSVLVFVVPASTALLIPYFQADASEYLRFTAAFEIALFVAGLGVFPIALKRHAAGVRWIRGERSAETAPEAWESTVAGTPGTTLLCLAWYSLCAVPAALYINTITHLSAGGVVLFILFWIFLFVGVDVFALLFFEQTLNPVAREIAAYLPANFTSKRRTLSLRVKLLVLLPAINLFTGSVVAAVSTNNFGLEDRLAVTLGASVFVTMTVSLVLTLMFRRWLLLRLGIMRQTIARVDRGDYQARVPQLAGDELDEVGRSFNRLVAGLHERGLLQEALGSYVDEGIAEQVIAEGEVLKGRELEVTVLFLDIRDFTSFAEDASAAEVVSFLGDFFDLVIPIIRAHRGHPNKLLGDGLMAVFGAPNPLERHADYALQAGIEILAAVRRHHRGRLRVGVGLHSGEVLAGTIGGGGKLDYTLIGDTVNVAARVEELTKATGCPLLFTDATRKRLLRPETGIEPYGAQRLRGKAEAMKLFTAGVAAAREDAEQQAPLEAPQSLRSATG